MRWIPFRAVLDPGVLVSTALSPAGAPAELVEIWRDGVAPGLTPDPKDDYLVALARSAAAHFLVSGDPHLTELVNPRPPVLTPRAFLDIVS